MNKVSQQVNFAGISMKNPVVVASGTYGFGREYGQFYDLRELGGICCKGLTLAPREGNPPPRVAETPMGILNSVGLQNPGVDAFIAQELPELRKHDVKIIANISGNTPEEYGILCQKLSDAGVDMIEVNVSCPNVKCGGLQYGVVPEMTAEVTEVAKKHSAVPVMVKLSPNVTDITAIAKAVESAGADAVSLINTVRGMRDRREHPPPHFEDEHRRPVRPSCACPLRCGWCGRWPMWSTSLCWAWAVSPPAEDAAQMMLAGASAVAVGTANFVNPYAPLQVRDELAAIAERQGLSSVTELTGGVLPW